MNKNWENEEGKRIRRKRTSASTYLKPWRLLMTLTTSLWSSPCSAANSPESEICSLFSRYPSIASSAIFASPTERTSLWGYTAWLTIRYPTAYGVIRWRLLRRSARIGEIRWARLLFSSFWAVKWTEIVRSNADFNKNIKRCVLFWKNHILISKYNIKIIQIFNIKLI